MYSEKISSVVFFEKNLFTLLACCPTLNVLLENDVKDKKGKYEGVYTFEGLSDGIDYWVDADGAHAMWYLESGSNYYWQIGYLVDLGTYTVAMYASSMLEKKCPNNEGYVWDWFYSNNGFQATNDIYVKCANEDDFCTFNNPCGTNQGDCDTHNECQDGFFCGSNNCPDSLGFHSEFDCCYLPAVGDEHFCTSANPCGIDHGDCDSNIECEESLVCGSNNCQDPLGPEIDCCTNNVAVGDEHFCTIDNPCGIDEGDCDSNNECQTNLFCDKVNSCPAYLGFNSDVDCCFVGGCKSH